MAILLLAAVLAALGCSSPVRTAPVEPASSRPVEALAHDLTVTISPPDHRLVATDRVTLRSLADGVRRIELTLNPRFAIRQVTQRAGTEERALDYAVAPGVEADPASRLLVRLPVPLRAGELLLVEVDYEGIVRDPPRPSPHLRFVAPSETSGHIGPDGVYLTGETRWYPDVAGSLATYDLRVTVPAGWQAVTHGREESRATNGKTVTAAWQVSARTEALTLVANRFVKTQRRWNGIELETYLFPEEAALAEDYLAATQRYLEVYTTLLGPYPFPKFAVVENFFPSGLGMPSFTLLGSEVIKRRYTQPYALGHEIVHSWLGNAVLNDVEQGNWVEGLTTYLANYYYEELTGPPATAAEERRRMLVGYAVYVWPEEDYPLAAFRRKSDQKDNAIGYQKAAMVFHMLRREIGDDAFWSSLRAFIATRRGRYATWQDLERQVGETAGRSLRWFFEQWVERPGAPELAVSALETELEPGRGGHGTLRVRLQQRQASEPYRLRIPVVVSLEDGTVLDEQVIMEERTHVVRLAVPSPPAVLRIDPQSHVFHRLSRDGLPPTLNLYVTDRSRSLVTPSRGDPASRRPYETLSNHIASRKEGHAIHRTARLDRSARDGSVLILGGPSQNPAVAWALRGCPDDVDLRDDRFTVGGTRYEAPEMALLVSCRHPERPEHVVTIFYGLTPAAAADVARLLFFYGWQSYVVFQDGRPVARGDFQAERNPLETRIPG